MQTIIWWIRRDLRLRDNPALHAAVQNGAQVVPLFILDPKLLNSSYSSPRRQRFLFAGLQALHDDLRVKGSRLILRRGDPLAVLHSLFSELGGDCEIHAAEDYSPYAEKRDASVTADLPLRLFPGTTIRPAREVVKADGSPYTVFTPYSRAWISRGDVGALLPAPARINTPRGIATDTLPEMEMDRSDTLFPSGEVEALRRLQRFFDFLLDHYSETRDRMDLDGTSSLSPYLRFGMLSPRQAALMAEFAMQKAADAAVLRSAETWLNELIWREFYFSVLASFPFVREMSFREEMRAIHWSNNEAAFSVWKKGETGYPVVDAAMRQLLATGWMHNRARMIAASFLTKDLLIDWRWGEKFFMQHLLDGDPAANNGGWQWSAGTGTDAAPYFRVFNPVLQGQKFDPQGEYVRRWVPELQAVPDQYIHAPWLMPADVQSRVGVIVGKKYPAPIVDHALARERVLLVYGNRINQKESGAKKKPLKLFADADLP